MSDRSDYGMIPLHGDITRKGSDDVKPATDEFRAQWREAAERIARNDFSSEKKDAQEWLSMDARIDAEKERVDEAEKRQFELAESRAEMVVQRNAADKRNAALEDKLGRTTGLLGARDKLIPKLGKRIAALEAFARRVRDEDLPVDEIGWKDSTRIWRRAAKEVLGDE